MGFSFQACIDENLDMVKFLVENRANVNQQDNEGWTPLHAAASCGYLNIAEWVSVCCGFGASSSAYQKLNFTKNYNLSKVQTEKWLLRTSWHSILYPY